MFQKKSFEHIVLSRLTSEVQTDNVTRCRIRRDTGQYNVQSGGWNDFSTGGDAENELREEILDNAVCVISVDALETGDSFQIL
jgi:hypothetical protein